VIEALSSSNGMHADELSRQLGLDIAKLGSLMLIMEVKGWIKNIGSGKYIRL
jgi:hypothetical protein